MKCPFCSHTESKVIDSRVSGAGDSTRRRRECERCARRFTTYERVDEMFPYVVKRDGRRESYDRTKLLAGLRRACDKRAVPLDRIEGIVGAIERELIDSSDREISAAQLGEKAMAHLRAIDEVAYVRFASVYRSFKDVGEFLSELQKIADERRKDEALS